MKKKEKIDWGVLAFVFIFCCCLRLGMHLDLKNPTYPNDLNAYQEKISIPRSVCGNDLWLFYYDNTNPTIFNGDIR